MYSINLGNYI